MPLLSNLSMDRQWIKLMEIRRLALVLPVEIGLDPDSSRDNTVSPLIRARHSGRMAAP